MYATLSPFVRRPNNHVGAALGDDAVDPLGCLAGALGKEPPARLDAVGHPTVKVDLSFAGDPVPVSPAFGLGLDCAALVFRGCHLIPGHGGVPCLRFVAYVIPLPHTPVNPYFAHSSQ